MKPVVGYLINRKDALDGERGLFYDYIIGGNGIFINSRNKFIDATIPVSYAEVKGLAPVEENVTLTHGRIPWRLYDLAYNLFLTDPHRERYVAIAWQDGYHLKVPDQERTPGSVRYSTEPDTVLDIHSHGHMDAWFSSTDDRDEQALRLYMVVGKVNMLIPAMELRVGVYGYFSPVRQNEVFGV